MISCDYCNAFRECDRIGAPQCFLVEQIRPINTLSSAKQQEVDLSKDDLPRFAGERKSAKQRD